MINLTSFIKDLLIYESIEYQRANVSDINVKR